MDTQKPNAASFGSSLVKNLGSALTSGLSGGVSGVISSAIQAPLQYAFDSLAAKREHGYDIEKMEKQFKLNREQYDYERSQESPAMERMRLEQAGLNPALMYGGGAQGGMNSGITGTSISSSPSPRSSMRQVSPAEVAQFKVSESQSEKLSAEADKEKALAEFYRKQTPTSGNLGDAKISLMWSEEQRNAWESQLFSATADLKNSQRVKQDFDNMFAEWKLPYDKQRVQNSVQESEYRLLGLIQEFEFKEDMNPMQLQLARAQLQVQISNILTAQVQRFLMQHQVYKTQAEITEIMAKEPYWSAQSEKLLADAENLRVKSETEKQMRGYKKAQAVVGMINETATTVIRGFSAWTSFGLSEATSKAYNKGYNQGYDAGNNYGGMFAD